MNIPKYPKQFHEKVRNSSNKEIKKMINEQIASIIDFMVKNNTDNHSVSFEDVLIIIDRITDESDVYFEISIANKHKVGYVKMK